MKTDQKKTAVRQFSRNKARKRRKWITPQVELFLYFLAPLVVMAILTLSGLGIVKAYYAKERERIASGEFTEKVQSPEAAKVSAEKLVHRHVEASGGLDAIFNLRRLEFSGMIFIDGDRFSFDGFKSSGGRFSVRIRDLDSTAEVVIRSSDGAKVEVSDAGFATGSFVDALFPVFAEFQNPAIRFAEESRGEVIDIASQRVGGSPFVRLELQDVPPSSERTELFFDAHSLQLVARTDFDSPGGEHVFRYSDYKSVQGVQIPHTVIIQLNKRMPIRLHFGRIEGLLGDAASSSRRIGEIAFSEEGINAIPPP